MRREPLVEAASLVLSQCQCRSLAGTQPHRKCWQVAYFLAGSVQPGSSLALNKRSSPAFLRTTARMQLTLTDCVFRCGPVRRNGRGGSRQPRVLHDRPSTRGEQAATDACDARCIAGSCYNRWLLGRHRHQDVSLVDGEVAGNADGYPEDPDGVLDHVIGLLETQPILGAKGLEDALVEAGRLGQQFMSTTQVPTREV